MEERTYVTDQTVLDSTIERIRADTIVFVVTVGVVTVGLAILHAISGRTIGVAVDVAVFAISTALYVFWSGQHLTSLTENLGKAITVDDDGITTGDRTIAWDTVSAVHVDDRRRWFHDLWALAALTPKTTVTVTTTEGEDVAVGLHTFLPRHLVTGALTQLQYTADKHGLLRDDRRGFRDTRMQREVAALS